MQCRTLVVYSSRLTHYDLQARRVLLEHRVRFAKLVMLTWSGGLSAASRAFAAAIGEPCELLTNEATFQAKLFAAAPQARFRLEP